MKNFPARGLRTKALGTDLPCPAAVARTSVEKLAPAETFVCRGEGVAPVPYIYSFCKFGLSAVLSRPGPVASQPLFYS